MLPNSDLLTRTVHAMADVIRSNATRFNLQSEMNPDLLARTVRFQDDDLAHIRLRKSLQAALSKLGYQKNLPRIHTESGNTSHDYSFVHSDGFRVLFGGFSWPSQMQLSSVFQRGTQERDGWVDLSESPREREKLQDAMRLFENRLQSKLK